MDVQLFRQMLSEIPKGNPGYDQYTVPDSVAVEPNFVAFYHLQTHVHNVSCHLQISLKQLGGLTT